MRYYLGEGEDPWIEMLDGERRGSGGCGVQFMDMRRRPSYSSMASKPPRRETMRSRAATWTPMWEMSPVMSYQIEG